MNKKYTVNILGDICLTNDNSTMFQTGKIKKLFNSVDSILNSGDLNIGNLEAPLTIKENNPILKTGPNLSFTREAIDLLKLAPFNIFSLANNHILDYGPNALMNTINELEKRDINYVGAGKNLSDAREPFIVNLDNFSLGIMSLAENEFSIASDNTPGANGLDYFNSFEDISRAKKNSKYLIVIFHGGIEYYKYPSPLLKKTCRKMIESGADLVLCQHSHCIGSKEDFLHGTILYGQGNAVFGYKEGNKDWNQGLLVQLKLSLESMKINYIPITALNKGGIDLLNDTESKSVLNEFEKRSELIREDLFVNNSWDIFCDSKKSMYYPELFGLNRYFNFINRKTKNKLVDLFYSKKRKMITHNLVRCESHHEVISTILKNYYK